MKTAPVALDAVAPGRLMRVENLQVTYALGGSQRMRAVDGVSFDIARGETLALVGESGCGKSSVARALMQLAPASGGDIQLEGQSLAKLTRGQLKQLRRRFQMIFQDPISSLNPKRRVRDILAAPLKVNGLYDKQKSEPRIREALELVGLDAASVMDRYPHEFSGGQCQRISIARALILDPALLVCDEPVSALDVSVRAQVLNVLNDLRRRLGLAMLFISHDLAVVRNVADRVAVMYLGRIVEIGEADAVLRTPAHPYTAALLSAVPVADPDAARERILLKGEMPSPMALPSGCRFRTRCPAAQPRCASVDPVLIDAGDDRRVACHFPFSVTSTVAAPRPPTAAPTFVPHTSQETAP
ncbi:ABC transporter ATP-binding protein [Variovorax guangxiensis]|nr:oligopeptide/dipeptide ABC transporter ATP-binding protein [Variovorax guangxiensis]